MTTAEPPPQDDSTGNQTTLRLTLQNRPARATPPDLLRVSRLELRRLIRRCAASGAAASTVEPTTLVNEVARRLLGAGGAQDLSSRGDFYADMALAFRRLLADADVQAAAFWLSVLDTQQPVGGGPLHLAISDLELRSPRHAQVATLRLLGGMTDDEIAEQLTTPPLRVAIAWSDARRWLASRLASA